MKPGCYECVLKHLGDAAVNATEAHLGYPDYWADVIGNLCQASEEAYQYMPELAECIRQHRVRLIRSLIEQTDYVPPFRALFGFALLCARYALKCPGQPLPAVPDELQPDGDFESNLDYWERVSEPLSGPG
jgi:hypothetical protein